MLRGENNLLVFPGFLFEFMTGKCLKNNRETENFQVLVNDIESRGISGSIQQKQHKKRTSDPRG